jgi:hypothetical protein
MLGGRCWMVHGNLGPVYTMDHVVGPWRMAFLHGPTSMVRFLKKSIYKAFGPFTRCKPNVDQEAQPCIKTWMCHYFQYIPQKSSFEKKNQLWPFSCLLLSSSSLPQKINYYKFIISPYLFLTIAHLLLLPPQNPLDHVNGLCRPSIMSFGDLELHGHYDIFFPWGKPKWSQDEFNSQSHIYRAFGTTSWSMVWTTSQLLVAT